MRWLGLLLLWLSFTFPVTAAAEDICRKEITPDNLVSHYTLMLGEMSMLNVIEN